MLVQAETVVTLERNILRVFFRRTATVTVGRAKLVKEEHREPSP